jgi:predicted RNA methylase
MATDLELIVRTLAGGQLAAYARDARHVIAVDPDRAGLERLSARVQELGLAAKFTLLTADLLSVRARGDAVLFEFCLHELPDPERALAHAAGLAPDVLVIDHAPGSAWMWHAAEDAGVDAAWAAVARRPVRRQLDVAAVQRFRDHAELAARFASLGPLAHERIERFRAHAPIEVPMPYRLVLL